MSRRDGTREWSRFVVVSRGYESRLGERGRRERAGEHGGRLRLVPTVHREGPYRFFFYSADNSEPPHVHVEREATAQSSGSIRYDLLAAAALGRRNCVKWNGWLSPIDRCCWGHGMSTSSQASEISDARAQRVVLTDDSLVVELVDGRTVSVPIAWYPRLSHASQAERTNWRLIGEGEGIHWPSLDEDVSVDGLLAGRRSGETQVSLRRWLESRKAG